MLIWWWIGFVVVIQSYLIITAVLMSVFTDDAWGSLVSVILAVLISCSMIFSVDLR